MKRSGAPERIEWQRPAELPGTEILLADNCARRWRTFHETYTVCTGLGISRPAEWRYRGKTYLQTAHGLMLMEPGELHANTKVTAPAWFRVLLIDPSIVMRAAEDLGIIPGRLHLRVAQLHGGALHRAFVGLHASLERPSTTLERQSRFVTCLLLLLDQCTETGQASLPPRGDHPAVQRARAFIHEHVADRIGLQELVAAAGSISLFHLVRTFTAEVGLPPHAYQIQLRVDRARALLATGMPAADVAAELGFVDQSHLTRHFHHLVGVTPAVYARAIAPGRPMRVGPFSRLATCHVGSCAESRTTLAAASRFSTPSLP